MTRVCAEGGAVAAGEVFPVSPSLLCAFPCSLVAVLYGGGELFAIESVPRSFSSPASAWLRGEQR